MGIGDVIMSNIGNKPIIIPNMMKVSIENNIVYVEGPLGKLSQKVQHVNVIIRERIIFIKLAHKKKKFKKFHGLYRSLINNMINGAVNGFQKVLILNGLGYKVSIKN